MKIIANITSVEGLTLQLERSGVFLRFRFQSSSGKYNFLYLLERGFKDYDPSASILAFIANLLQFVTYTDERLPITRIPVTLNFGFDSEILDVTFVPRPNNPLLEGYNSVVINVAIDSRSGPVREAHHFSVEEMKRFIHEISRAV